MFHNYFFLKRLAPDLGKKLKGQSLLECFSQNKDELILGFGGQDRSFYIRANLDPNVSLLSFPEDFARAGKNSVDLFSELLDKEVTSVSVFEFERSFQIKLGEDALIFKMHGRRANILHSKNNEVVSLFRKNLSPDFDIVPDELNKKIEVSESELVKHNYDPTSLIPALGKETKIYLEQDGFYEKGNEEKWKRFNQLLNQLNHNPIYLHCGPFVSLLKPSDEQTDSAIEATNWLYNKTVRGFYFEKERNQAINKLKQRIKKSESYISKTRSKLQQVECARSPEEIANILMANLNSLQTGLSKAVLHDFYNDEPIEIKLNRELSPQKNAENLYRKAKNRHQEIDALNENIAAKEKLIDRLSRQILHIDELSDAKELRKYLKERGLAQKEKVKEENLPYHEFEFDGWQILLGKHAKANDELTLKVANKNDLWLHAKDVAGSHVVVRQKPGQNFPTHIIEKAAALAAANSKRKTDTLCPVIYTLKKFVRKAKGAPAGQVIVEKEEVVMVEPKIL
ncbi:NFACT RNA binding domain-containing protein [Ekhidna sp. MALMAid0563]|uniref:NFACT RNA binding domain-containing protein n=1 Tax=Ekhidna sp. MALMAid0563 TaxID=3143937 RepID=UPI0032DEE884